MLKKLADAVEKIQISFSVILFVVFLLCVVVQILTRYVPFIKITWTEEVAVYAFIWTILMGAAVELKRNEHFAFEVLRGSLKGNAKLALEVIIYLLLTVFCIYVTWCGTKLVTQFWSWSLTSLPKVSQRYTWSALVVSGATMTLYSISNMLEEIRKHGKEATK